MQAAEFCRGLHIFAIERARKLNITGTPLQFLRDPVNSARIATLLEPFLENPLAPQALEQISTYIDLLQRWNSRVNLTAVRSEDEIVTRHFGEALFLARHVFPDPAMHCQPERSLNPVSLSGAERSAEPKDPYPLANCQLGARSSRPEPRCHRHRFRRRFPRHSSENLGS